MKTDDTVTTFVGTHYMDAIETRKTAVEHRGMRFSVRENKWCGDESDDHWTVTFDMRFSEVENGRGLAKQHERIGNAIRVLSGLDYEFHEMLEPGVVAWRKPAE